MMSVRVGCSFMLGVLLPRLATNSAQEQQHEHDTFEDNEAAPKSDEYSFSNFEMKCGTKVSATCAGKTVAADSGFTDASFKKFVSGSVNVFTSGLNIFLSTSTQAFSLNMMKGINALRCAVVSFGENAWNFIAGAWWALHQFNQQKLVEDMLHAAWQYICTCNDDMDFISQMLGATGAGVAVFATCSEAAASTALLQTEKKKSFEIRNPEDMECTMDGYVELTLEAYNVLLFGLASLKEAYATALPSALGKSVNYTWDGILGAGEWVGYVVAALYYFGLEFGYADIMCQASGCVYVAVGLGYQFLAFSG